MTNDSRKTNRSHRHGRAAWPVTPLPQVRTRSELGSSLGFDKTHFRPFRPFRPLVFQRANPAQRQMNLGIRRDP
jgi:hypothetical protein